MNKLFFCFLLVFSCRCLYGQLVVFSPDTLYFSVDHDSQFIDIINPISEEVLIKKFDSYDTFFSFNFGDSLLIHGKDTSTNLVAYTGTFDTAFEQVLLFTNLVNGDESSSQPSKLMLKVSPPEKLDGNLKLLGSIDINFDDVEKDSTKSLEIPYKNIGNDTLLVDVTNAENISEDRNKSATFYYENFRDTLLPGEVGKLRIYYKPKANKSSGKITIFNKKNEQQQHTINFMGSKKTATEDGLFNMTIQDWMILFLVILAGLFLGMLFFDKRKHEKKLKKIIDFIVEDKDTMSDDEYYGFKRKEKLENDLDDRLLPFLKNGISRKQNLWKFVNVFYREDNNKSDEIKTDEDQPPKKLNDLLEEKKIEKALSELSENNISIDRLKSILPGLNMNLNKKEKEFLALLKTRLDSMIKNSRAADESIYETEELKKLETAEKLTDLDEGPLKEKISTLISALDDEPGKSRVIRETVITQALKESIQNDYLKNLKNNITQVVDGQASIGFEKIDTFFSEHGTEDEKAVLDFAKKYIHSTKLQRLEEEKSVFLNEVNTKLPNPVEKLEEVLSFIKIPEPKTEQTAEISIDRLYTDFSEIIYDLYEQTAKLVSKIKDDSPFKVLLMEMYEGGNGKRGIQSIFKKSQELQGKISSPEDFSASFLNEEFIDFVSIFSKLYGYTTLKEKGLSVAEDMKRDGIEVKTFSKMYKDFCRNLKNKAKIEIQKIALGNDKFSKDNPSQIGLTTGGDINTLANYKYRDIVKAMDPLTIFDVDKVGINSTVFDISNKLQKSRVFYKNW